MSSEQGGQIELLFDKERPYFEFLQSRLVENRTFKFTLKVAPF